MHEVLQPELYQAVTIHVIGRAVILNPIFYVRVIISRKTLMTDVFVLKIKTENMPCGPWLAELT